MIGRNKGRQAPTIPSEDSTIGQYRVGVKRSFREWVSLAFGHAYSLTCEVLVTRIGLLGPTVVSNGPYLFRNEAKLTKNNLIENDQL